MPGPLTSLAPSSPIGFTDYSSAYPAIGLASLAEGFTKGMEIGHQWKHEADQLNMHNQNYANEAANRAAMLKIASDRETAGAGLMAEKIKAMEGKMNNPAVAAGQPIMNNGELVGYTDGHGGIKMPAAPKKGANNATADQGVLTAIKQAEDQYVGTPGKPGIASSNRATAIPGVLAKLGARIDPNSDQSDYHRTVVNLASMLPKKLSGRSNWPEIEAHMKNIPEYGPDAEKAKQYFGKLRALVGGDSAPPVGQILINPQTGHKIQLVNNAWVDAP